MTVVCVEISVRRSGVDLPRETVSELPSSTEAMHYSHPHARTQRALPHRRDFVRSFRRCDRCIGDRCHSRPLSVYMYLSFSFFL